MAVSDAWGARFRAVVVLAAALALTACATARPRFPVVAATVTAATPGEGGAYVIGKPYEVEGVRYVPREQWDLDEVGVISWYGDDFHLKKTANGERFDRDAVSGAHPTLPLPSIVDVTNLDNGRTLRVRVNERGPFVKSRIMDVSREAARQLGFDRAGVARARVQYVGPGMVWHASGRHIAQSHPKSRRTDRPAPEPLTLLTERVDPPVATARLTRPPARLQLQTEPAPVLLAEAPAAAPLAARPAAATVAASAPYRVQAGSFANPDNARRAVSLLKTAGPAAIEQVDRDGVTLYRVLVAGPSDAAKADALRARVAEAGFADARVIRTF
ncbi:septal ring lytic transglycosylase RlpA family protein [Phenylobacterium sp.]|jgi:rare lipoprotein A|uniref:septal ring lytic transglycosylase RlpA family protein n=1 Tax=Phenylobacterium sp. TaxID=1871053 RepID=UPI002F9276EB